jgi:hypothetical protein
MLGLVCAGVGRLDYVLGAFHFGVCVGLHVVCNYIK